MSLQRPKLSHLLACFGVLSMLAVMALYGQDFGELRQPKTLTEWTGFTYTDDPDGLETNTDRLARINNVCRRERIGNTDANVLKSFRFAAGHILVDDKHKTLYCFAPKVGCTSWKYLMMRLVSELDNATFSAKYNHSVMAHRREIQRKLGLYRLSEYTANGQMQRLDSYFKFMITRDPFTRLVSAYNDKFKEQGRLFWGAFGQSLKRTIEDDSNDLEFPADNRTVSFAELVLYVVSMYERSRQNGHWHSVSQWCQPCLVHYDYVGKVETMDVDAKNILSNMGTPEAYKFLPHYNAHGHHQSLQSIYGRLPKHAVNSLLKLYRNDTLMFGYKIPSYL